MYLKILKKGEAEETDPPTAIKRSLGNYVEFKKRNKKKKDSSIEIWWLSEERWEG